MGKKITWSWVKGHSGDYFNELCDRIANEEAEAAGMSRESRPEPDPDPEAGTPENSRPDPESIPNGAEAVRILADVFTAAARAEDFDDFRELLGEFEKNIRWNELIYGRPQTGPQGTAGGAVRITRWTWMTCPSESGRPRTPRKGERR